MIIVQSTLLFLFINDKLASYPVSVVDSVWIVSSLLNAVCGILFFMLNKEIKVPVGTVFIIAVLGIFGFQFMLFKRWLPVLFLVVLAFGLHFYRYKNSKFSIFPVISLVMGLYTIGLYVLMKGITSM